MKRASKGARVKEEVSNVAEESPDWLQLAPGDPPMRASTMQLALSSKPQGYQDIVTTTGIQLQEPLLTVRQIFNVEIFDHMLVSQFVALQTHPQPNMPPGWATRLLEFFSYSKQPALKYSIRAVSTAFYAVHNNDRAAHAEACRWYIRGLSSHQAHLSRSLSLLETTSPGEKSLPGVEEILIPIILCLFEVFACTSSAACYQHLSAACKMVEMRGPENCQRGPIHQLFCTMRVSDTSLSLECSSTADTIGMYCHNDE